ncbi:MAG TPA: NADH:ubiquinone reductase (Na(+)-transporting) subunit B [Vicinamibacteria bacterium]|nr:NADH:ubiquinone reductase (Na(+)-transporting) subunit B [Vicinamibacteria bacterium]
MRFLRILLDKQEKLFFKGGKLERLHPLYEAGDTFLFTPGKTTDGASHIRDALDLKRTMMVVVAALVGTVFMAFYNTGFQANLAISKGALPLDNWQTAAMAFLALGFDPSSFLSSFVHGGLYYVPVLVTTFAVGGGWEVVFAAVRRHEMNEGFLVTGMLFPLILPPTIPLWQVALGISFGVVVGKEIFGGTGYNILNPALVARAFVFFAYPAQISGDDVWIAAQTSADGVSGATWLAVTALQGHSALTAGLDWWDAFWGFVPGSMGETSFAACLLGALVLIVTGIGSWRIIASVTAGTMAASLLLNTIGSETNPFFDVPFWWQFVLGGWAFGTVFMATEPVTAPGTDGGRLVYGFFIGVLVVLIRVVNPAYPEGMMLAILFMNVFAPLIDHFAIRANVRRRRSRYAGRTAFERAG